MKILFPIDGSPHSLAALTAFIDRRAWFREAAELTLLYAHPPLPYKRAAAWAGKDAVHSYYEEESEAVLADARKLLDDRGVAYAVEKRVGDPAEEIVACADAGAFALVIMGTHGHTALVNLVMGSVATKVLAARKVPVLFMV
jgi:nucleotide-binding universal stress UspA family protein